MLQLNQKSVRSLTYRFLTFTLHRFLLYISSISDDHLRLCRNNIEKIFIKDLCLNRPC